MSAQQQQTASTTLGSNSQTASMNYSAAIPEPRRPANSAAPARAVAAPVPVQRKWVPPKPINQQLNLQTQVAGGGAAATNSQARRPDGELDQPHGTRSQMHISSQFSPAGVQVHHLQSDVQPRPRQQQQNYMVHNGKKYSTMCEPVEGHKVNPKQHIFPASTGGECLTCGIPSEFFSRCEGAPDWAPESRPERQGGTNWLQCGHTFRTSRDINGKDNVLDPYCSNILPDGTRCRKDYWAIWRHPCVQPEDVTEDSAPGSPIQRENAFNGNAFADE